MANTIADQTMTGAAWQNAYTLSGQSVGTALAIQNKSLNPMWVQIAASKPSESSTDGMLLAPGEQAYVSAGEAGCWVLGSGKVSIQKGA